MKAILPLLIVLSGSVLAVEGPIPTAYTADRYDAMSEKSPFALATAAAPAPPPPQASFAANWYLTGVGRDEEGRDFVTIASQDQSVHFSVAINEVDDKTKVSLASVNWEDGYKKSTAIVKLGSETAKLEFSQMEMAPAVAPGGAGGPGGRFGAGRAGGPGGGTPQTPVVVAPVVTAQAMGGGMQNRGINGGINGGTGAGGRGQQGNGNAATTRLPRPSGGAGIGVTTPVTQQPQQYQQQNRQNQGGNSGTTQQGAGENRRRVRTIGAP